MILATIIVINIVILILSSFVIFMFMRETFGNVGYWKTVYYTLGMILDAGFMENVVSDVGSTSIILVIICLLVIIIGSITFTGGRLTEIKDNWVFPIVFFFTVHISRNTVHVKSIFFK